MTLGDERRGERVERRHGAAGEKLIVGARSGVRPLATAGGVAPRLFDGRADAPPYFGNIHPG